MNRPPWSRLGLVYMTGAALVLVCCKKQGFQAGGNTSIKRKSDAVDAGDKNDTLSQDAFSTHGNDPESKLSQASEDRIRTTIPVARVCSDRYTEKAQTNLLRAESGVVVKFTDPANHHQPVLFGLDNPQALRKEMIERGTMTVAAPRGVWNISVCDARATQCFQPGPGFAALGVDGVGRLGNADQITFGSGKPASGRLGVLYNINQERQQMFSMFQNVLMQGMFNGGLNLVNPGDVAFCDDSVSPLVIDLTGLGISLTAPEDGVTFDIDHDGEKERISWVTAESGAGFLALDKNDNGTIDSGNELFGNFSVGPDGETSDNGFDALVKYDSNHDGSITRADEIWSALLVWQDRNMDGHSQADELSSLSDAGISLFDLTYIDGFEFDNYGNWTKQRSVAAVNGKLQMVFDIWFRL